VLLLRLGIGAVDLPTMQREGKESVSNGNGANENGAVKQPAENRPKTVAQVVDELERQQAAEVPAELPKPYELGNQVYPGTALWRGINTPEEATAVGRALSRLDPPHILAERAAD
jgi:hypothetical protein